MYSSTAAQSVNLQISANCERLTSGMLLACFPLMLSDPAEEGPFEVNSGTLQSWVGKKKQQGGADGPEEPAPLVAEPGSGGPRQAGGVHAPRRRH